MPPDDDGAQAAVETASVISSAPMKANPRRLFHRRLRAGFIGAITFALLMDPLSGVIAAAERPATIDRPVPARVDDAVERGLGYLARTQRPDGSIDIDPLAKSKEPAEARFPVASTGLSVLAFLSAGHTQDVGRYGLTVRAATDFLVREVPKEGYVGGVDDSRMYGQAIVALALAEALGVEPLADKRAEQQAALSRLVAVILKAQAVKKEAAFAGGWRYTPDAPDSDASLSGWCALALRAGQDVGVAVPKESIAAAADFVSRCHDKEHGGFAYQPGGAVTAGTTGAGVLCLFLLNRGDQPEAAAGLKYLAGHPFEDGAKFPYYSLYYATQAAWQGTDENWLAISKVTVEKLTKTQADDGSWPSLPGGADEPGRPYRTAMAVLTLTVPYRLLPIYQK